MNEIEKIYKQHADEIYRYCLFKTKSKELAEDLTAEIFEMFLKSRESIREPRAWLFQVSRNLIYKKLYKSSNKEDKNIETETIEAYEFDDHFEKKVIDQILVDLIKQEIEKLDSVSSEIITLKIWNEFKFSEIAAIVGLNENTVKVKYYRGLEQVKNSISKESKNKKLMSLNLPVILSGIYLISQSPSFEIAKAVKSNLFNIISASMAVSTTKNGILSIFSTTAAKVALASVATVAVTGAGVVGITTQLNKPKAPETVQQPQNIPPVKPPVEKPKPEYWEKWTGKIVLEPVDAKKFFKSISDNKHCPYTQLGVVTYNLSSDIDIRYDLPYMVINHKKLTITKEQKNDYNTFVNIVTGKQEVTKTHGKPVDISVFGKYCGGGGSFFSGYFPISYPKTDNALVVLTTGSTQSPYEDLKNMPAYVRVYAKKGDYVLTLTFPTRADNFLKEEAVAHCMKDSEYDYSYLENGCVGETFSKSKLAQAIAKAYAEELIRKFKLK